MVVVSLTALAMITACIGGDRRITGIERQRHVENIDTLSQRSEWAAETKSAELEFEVQDSNDSACTGVACGGGGRCVVVKGAASCECGPRYYRVGLACLSDPCERGGTCYYVDSESGSDDYPGSRELPWRTLNRAKEGARSLGPGDYLLFRRGGTWTNSGILRIHDVNGEPNIPVTIGAYDKGPRPRLRKITVSGVTYVTIRDFEQVGSARGPCISVSHSSYVTLQNIHAHDCQNNGLYFGAATDHGVMIDNRIWNIHGNDALVVHNPDPVTENTRVGDHFWIVDNVVPGGVPEQPIDIATGTNYVNGARDLKIVGNQLRGGGQGCVTLGHGSSVAWIIGNLMGDCTSRQTASALGVGGSLGMRSGTDYQIAGNAIFHNLMPSIQIRAGALPGPQVFIHHNTIINGIGRRPAIRANGEAQVELYQNIVWPTDSHAHVRLKSEEDVLSANDNWYVPEVHGHCRILGKSLYEWQRDSGHDSRSHCEPVPGVSEPSSEEASDIDLWRSPSFLRHFIPKPGWVGCDRHIGAFDCMGRQFKTFVPFKNYKDNGGYGWPGPLIVQQRYRIESSY